MEKFDKELYLKQGDIVVSKSPEFETAAEKINKKGFDNIILTAIGGTLARFYPVVFTMSRSTSIPVYLISSADLCVEIPPYLTKKSVVLSASNSGNTKEIINALKICRRKGATILSVGDPEECPLKDLSDYYVSAPIHLGEDMYLAFYMMGLSLLYKHGDFKDYPQWLSEMKNLHSNLIPLKQKFDKKAPEIARSIAKSPYVMMTSSGILEKISYWYCLCVLEEAQWIKSYSVSSSEFFHGALELLDEDQLLFVIKGVGAYRCMDERVERLAKKITKKLIVLDLEDYKIKGTSEKFADMYSVFVAASLLSDRLEVHLELTTGHSLSFRRYYRRFEY